MGRIWKYLKETPTWVWLALFLIAAMITTSSLRHNNLEMNRLRNAVYKADKSGNGVDEALNNLRGWVYGHMNTDLDIGNAIKPPIQLKYTYDRLAKAQQDKINQASEQILKNAAQYCAAREGGHYRQVCVENYSKQHNVKAPAPIPPALYQFDFASPTWSPDLAGWSLVISVVLALLTIVSFLADRLAAERINRQRRKAARA